MNGKENETSGEPKNMGTDALEGWSQHYTDPGDRETPVTVTVVLCHSKMVEIMTVPYDMAEFAVETHRKLLYPGWIVAIDILTGDVLMTHSTGV